jgi:predicted enzyme related to lactoylglutathione lyase
MAGKPVHLEIPAPDAAQASAFWGSLLGWQFQAMEGAPSPYLMTRFGDDSGGAIYEDPAERGLRVYFDVDDIDAGTSRVRGLGGESGEKMPVPSMGWFAHCTDPSGNAFGLWQNDPSASM